MNKKGTMILFAFGIVYIIVGISYINHEIVLNQQTLLSISMFAFFISFADLVESIANLLIYNFFRKSEKVRVILLIKTIVSNVVMTLYVIAVFFLIFVPIYPTVNIAKIEIVANTVTIVSFATIFLSIAIRDFSIDLKIKLENLNREGKDEEHNKKNEKLAE